MQKRKKNCVSLQAGLEKKKQGSIVEIKCRTTEKVQIN